MINIFVETTCVCILLAAADTYTRIYIRPQNNVASLQWIGWPALVFANTVLNLINLHWFSFLFIRFEVTRSPKLNSLFVAGNFWSLLCIHKFPTLSKDGGWSGWGWGWGTYVKVVVRALGASVLTVAEKVMLHVRPWSYFPLKNIYMCQFSFSG